MKIAMWFFVMTGCLGFFDWVFASAFVKIDADNRFAQLAASSWMLYASLTLMALGLLSAWFSGSQHRENGPNEETHR